MELVNFTVCRVNTAMGIYPLLFFAILWQQHHMHM